jgi:hypothetical protein
LGDSTLVNDVARSEGREVSYCVLYVLFTYYFLIFFFLYDQLHTISAIVGAMAAQEAFKFIVHQYEPANNTVVFNGYIGLGQTKNL